MVPKSLLRPKKVFLLCDSKFFYWGSYRKKNEVNRTTLREVMRFWRKTNLKWVQILNIWREISLQDNKKIFHPFFEYRISFCIVRLKVFFIEDHIKKNDVNRTTLREVLRFWSQNLSKISHKDNKKNIAKKKKFPTYLLGFVVKSEWNRKSETHIFFFFA